MDATSLGTIEATEQLITDLYINLRNKVNDWSEITHQTPQARMGYVGQHLVSVVTGYPGSKSGARGYDLIIDNTRYGEIKTCYRVDQLGECRDCHAVVSSLEKKCSKCGSMNIDRKADSKWLISIRHDQEFSEKLDPYRYYFVLFEFEDLSDLQNHNILTTIWEVDPTVKGFGYCMMDYYINIRANSTSKAPFNMWPYSFKFALTQPRVIYQSLIKDDGTIETRVFPTMNNTFLDKLKPLPTYAKATTITATAAKNVLSKFDPSKKVTSKKQKEQILESLDLIEQVRNRDNISNEDLCDAFADEIYLPLILPKKDQLPTSLTQHYPDLQ